MKKYIKYSGLFLLLATMSCTKFADDLLTVDSTSALDASVIFSNVDLAQNAVDGILIPMGETNSYRGRFIPWYGMNTDVEWYNSSETVNDNSDLVTYNTKANNTVMNTTNNVWAQMYTGIERANLSIQGLRTYGKPTAGSALGYLLGTALTYRAIYYADLLKTWGDVPARFEPIGSETIYLPKSNRDIVYKQIIADLGEAEDLVPWANGGFATGDTEHISKGFVKGLRARLAMAASGFQQYPDGVRRSTDPDLSVALMYKLALDECRSVINSGTVHLIPTFQGLWKDYYSKENITAGNESLWEIPFASGRGRVLYTFAVRHTSNDQFQQNGSNRGGQAGPLPNVFYDYNVKDTRRDVTCVPYLWGAAVNGIAKQQLGSINRWYFGKYRYEWMSRLVNNTNDDGMNFIYMRYAEVLLIAAEAANELEGPAAAAPYLTQIRARAFSPADQPTQVTAYVNNLTSKTAMFNAIVKENGYEFTGEMLRKQQLIRWNLLGTNVIAAKSKMTDLANRVGNYTDVPSTLYYKYAADGITLIVYGLNRGENTDPGAGYTAVAWNNLTDTKIAGLYTNNPDTKQFWPIWQVFIDASNGKLKNDYGY